MIPPSNISPMAAIYRAEAQDLVARAACHGIVITIEQRPLKPLKMGNYETVVSTRPVRPAQVKRCKPDDTEGGLP